MVERTYRLDSIFGSLGDPTRRDILRIISDRSMSVSEVAKNYAISLAGVAKHLSVLENAGLIKKTRRGKEQIVTIDPNGLATANDYLESYRDLWESRIDSLDKLLRSMDDHDEYTKSNKRAVK